MQQKIRSRCCSCESQLDCTYFNHSRKIEKVKHTFIQDLKTRQIKEEFSVKLAIKLTLSSKIKNCSEAFKSSAAHNVLQLKLLRELLAQSSFFKQHVVVCRHEVKKKKPSSRRSLFERSSSINHGTANCIREMKPLEMSQDDNRRWVIHAVAKRDPNAAATSSVK